MVLSLASRWIRFRGIGRWIGVNDDSATVLLNPCFTDLGSGTLQPCLVLLFADFWPKNV
jgi:hypothetical protein